MRQFTKKKPTPPAASAMQQAALQLMEIIERGDGAAERLDGIESDSEEAKRLRQLSDELFSVANWLLPRP